MATNLPRHRGLRPAPYELTRSQHELSTVLSRWRYTRAKYRNEEGERRINYVRQTFETHPYLVLPFLSISTYTLPDAVNQNMRYEDVDTDTSYEAIQQLIDYYAANSVDESRDVHEQRVLSTYIEPAIALFARLGYSDSIMHTLSLAKSNQINYTSGIGPYEPRTPHNLYAPTSPIHETDDASLVENEGTD